MQKLSDLIFKATKRNKDNWIKMAPEIEAELRRNKLIPEEKTPLQVFVEGVFADDEPT